MYILLLNGSPGTDGKTSELDDGNLEPMTRHTIPFVPTTPTNSFLFFIILYAFYLRVRMAKCEKASAAATAARTPKWKNMYKDRYPNCRNYNFLSLSVSL